MPGQTQPHKRIRRKPEAAQREILDAARQVLETDDFGDLTVDAIMDRTGMRRSAFYNYFTGRGDVVLRLVGEIEDEMLEASRVWFDDADGSETSLAVALDTAIAVWVRHSRVLRAFHDASYHDHEVQQHYRYGLVQLFIDAVATKLRKEKRAGRSSVPNPKDVAHALIMMNISVLSDTLSTASGKRSPGVERTLQFAWHRIVYGTVPA